MCIRDRVYRKYPEEITRLTERIAGYEQDVALVAAHPKAQEGFCGMEVDGRHYTEKEDAGKAIIDVCTRMTGSDAVLLGQYRGFSMVLALSLIHIFGSARKPRWWAITAPSTASS